MQRRAYLATERTKNSRTGAGVRLIAVLHAAWRVLLVIALLSGARGRAAEYSGLQSSVFSRPLSLADALNVALAQSPAILKARKTLELEHGLIVQTKAIALPKLGIGGEYRATEPSNVDRPPADIPGFTFGTEQSWGAQVRLVQSIYEGGRLLSAFRTARLLKERSLLNYNVAVADLILQVHTAYYGVLLAEEQIGVQEASIALLQRELTDSTRRFEAGVVPRFNVLRAEVELGNARPKLSRAQNQLRITRNVLANALGVSIPEGAAEDIPLQLSDKMVAEPLSIGLADAVQLALKQRDELAALRATRLLRGEETIQAKAGYKPRLQVFGGYETSSSLFSPDLTDEIHGWVTGVQMSWDIFDGGLTRGRVLQAKAQQDLASIQLEDAAREIELEVRTAYSFFIEAKEVLDSQQKVLEQAEEALRLASARSEAGTGTQLDVLAAQTSLTETRSLLAQALHNYCVARVKLSRAVGSIMPPKS